MVFGQGTHQYTVQEDWWTLPEGWEFGWIPAVAVDSQDRIYVYSRSEHPMVVFDRDGNFLDSWGDDILKDAHGIFIDADDNIYCTERDTHVVRKFTTEGELLMTLGTPDEPGAEGEPFNKPTDLALGPDGEMFISDGYGNARIHKYSPDGELIKSWGTTRNRSPASLICRIASGSIHVTDSWLLTARTIASNFSPSMGNTLRSGVTSCNRIRSISTMTISSISLNWGSVSPS